MPLQSQIDEIVTADKEIRAMYPNLKRAQWEIEDVPHDEFWQFVKDQKLSVFDDPIKPRSTFYYFVGNILIHIFSVKK